MASVGAGLVPARYATSGRAVAGKKPENRTSACQQPVNMHSLFYSASTFSSSSPSCSDMIFRHVSGIGIDA